MSSLSLYYNLHNHIFSDLEKPNIYEMILNEYYCRAEPGTPDLDSVLREIYVLYSDCALVRWKCVKKNAMSLYVSLWNKRLVNKKVMTYASLLIHHCRRIPSMSWKCLFDVSCSHWLWMVWSKDWSLVLRFDRRRLILLLQKREAICCEWL